MISLSRRWTSSLTMILLSYAWIDSAYGCFVVGAAHDVAVVDPIFKSNNDLYINSIGTVAASYVIDKGTGGRFRAVYEVSMSAKDGPFKLLPGLSTGSTADFLIKGGVTINSDDTVAFGYAFADGGLTVQELQHNANAWTITDGLPVTGTNPVAGLLMGTDNKEANYIGYGTLGGTIQVASLKPDSISWNLSNPQSGAVDVVDIAAALAKNGKAFYAYDASQGKQLNASPSFQANRLVLPNAVTAYRAVGVIDSFAAGLTDAGSASYVVADTGVTDFLEEIQYDPKTKGFSKQIPIPLPKGVMSTDIEKLELAVDEESGNELMTVLLKPAKAGDLYVYGFDGADWGSPTFIGPFYSQATPTITAYGAAVIGTVKLNGQSEILHSGGFAKLASFDNYDSIELFWGAPVSVNTSLLIRSALAPNPNKSDPRPATVTYGGVVDPIDGTLMLKAGTIQEILGALRLKARREHSSNVITWQFNREGPKVKKFKIFYDANLTQLAGVVKPQLQGGRFKFVDKCSKAKKYYFIAEYVNGQYSGRQSVKVKEG